MLLAGIQWMQISSAVGFSRSELAARSDIGVSHLQHQLTPLAMMQAEWTACSGKVHHSSAPAP